MIKITYPGTGNYSTFSYDGLSRNVGIVETTSGSVTSTKQFTWSNGERCEERYVSGSVVKQFFAAGQLNGTSDLYYSLDHLGSIREIENSAGVIQTECNYDCFGRQQMFSSAVAMDFGLAGYYLEGRIGCYLTKYRMYNPQTATWTSRDPLGEDVDANLFAYVDNAPTNWTDWLGLLKDAGAAIAAAAASYTGKPAHQELRPTPN